MDAFVRREGDVWAIQLDGRTARVRDSRGMQHLAVLLARPGVEVHVLELAGAPEAVTSGDAGPLLDESARTAYKRRLTDLASDLDEADAFNDVERSARIQAEIDALVDQLTAATGLGGKDRGAVTDAERARVAVRRALKSALDRIADVHPALGAHLAATVRTGTFCAYVPDPASPVRWLVGDAAVATAAAPVSSSTSTRPVVVGRESERDALRSAWHTFGVVLVSGEPGIGKTTLVRDLEADVEVALHGRCDDHLGVSYQPIVEAIRTLIAVDGAPAIAADAGIGAAALARLLPELGVSTAASDPIDTERLILFDTVARVLRSAADRRPLLLAVDDLHWAQPPTLALLLHVLRELDGAPVLTVLTYRDTEIGDDLTAFLAGLVRDVNVSRIALMGIDVESIVELGASNDDAKRLLEHTGGNPYFVRALLDAPLEEALPRSVLDVMRGRVQKLSTDAQRAVTLIALAGDRVPVAVAASLAGSVDPLDELLDAGLVVEDGPSIALPHALARRAVTDTTSGVRRASLHLEIARALETAGAPDADLAFHFGEASVLGDNEPASRYAIKAAEAALRSFAFEEAMALAERGLGIVQPDTSDDARLQLNLGYAYASAGDMIRANAAFAEARRIAIALSDWPLLADTVLARSTGGNTNVHDEELAADLADAIERLGGTDPTRRAPLLAVLAVEESGAGRVVEARRLAAEAVDVARASGDLMALHESVWAKWIVFDAPELLGDRIALSSELDAVATAHGGVNERIRAKGFVATTAAETGDIEALDTALAEVSLLTQASRMPRNEWYDLELRVLRAVIAGDLDDAERLAERELEIGMAVSVPNAWRGYTLQLLVIRWEQGRAGELADLALERADDDDLPGTRVMAAVACVEAGRTEEARALLQRVDLASLPNDSLQLGTLCAAASLASELGDRSMAAQVDALLAPYAGRNCDVARGTISIGPVDRYLSFTARALGEHARAEHHLAAAVALDERMRARRWLERDRADLAAISGSTTRS